MAQIRKSVLLEYPAEFLYALVERVEDYPAFLPWCGGVSVDERSPTQMLATLQINYHGLRSHFATRNTQEPGRSISMRLHDGPFRVLDGQWRFTPLGAEACKVEFELHYEFSNALLEKMLGRVFSHIAGTFIEAFVQRAAQIRKEEKQ